MKSREFINQLDEAKIVEAIAAAERRSSGEIRVFISDRQVNDDPLARAEQRFAKLGMTKTRERNGVLLYFAPRSQKFAICGDTGIHEKCGPAFWEEVAAEIETQMRAGSFTQAVTSAVEKVGGLLARHFPRRGDDSDELPNEIVRD